MLRWLPGLFEWFARQAPDQSSDTTGDKPAPQSGDGTTKTLFEHLDDLRATLIRAALAWFVGFNVCLIFANHLLRFLEAPLRRILPNPESCLQSLNVTDSFVLAVKLSAYGGLILALPLVFYFIGDFILPALKPRERSTIVPAFIAGALLFVSGVALCYYVMIPQTLKAFIEYSAWLGITPQWTISSYVDFITQFMLAVGTTFEVPLVILILVRLGILKAATVARNRRIMIAVAVVLAAVLAPPDPLSMLVMALPLILMFEITIWLARLVEKRTPAQT